MTGYACGYKNFIDTINGRKGEGYGKNSERRDMSTGSEKMSYWSYLIGQNFSYTMMSVFLTTYMMMQGVDLGIIAIIMVVVRYGTQSMMRFSV